MQNDGNLVHYAPGSVPLWASNTGGSGNWAVMQNDGNFVVYTAGGQPLWASNTAGNPGAFLVVQNDSNLVVYIGSRPIWARTGLSQDERATVLVTFGGFVSSSPTNHHIVYGGDWSIDLASSGGGVPVHASFANVSGALSLQVIDVRDACTAPANGGRRVTVRVTIDGTAVGNVVYSHLASPVGLGPIANGQQIGVLATGLPYNESCWTGPHLHLEPRNDRAYACYLISSGSFAAGRSVAVLGGRFASGIRQGCPAGVG